jgi:hypothetical protein
VSDSTRAKIAVIATWAVAIAGLLFGLIPLAFPDADESVKLLARIGLAVTGLAFLLALVAWVVAALRRRRKRAPRVVEMSTGGITAHGRLKVRGSAVGMTITKGQYAIRVQDNPVAQLYPGTEGVLISLHPNREDEPLIAPGNYYCRVHVAGRDWDSPPRTVAEPGSPLVQVVFPGDFVNGPKLPLDEDTYTVTWSRTHGFTKVALATTTFTLPLE